MEHLQAGVYRHYKGPLYLVLGLAHDANVDTLYTETGTTPPLALLGEREVVVYVGLQLDEAHTGARLAVRSVEDFFAIICIDKEHRHYGQAVTKEDRVVCDTRTRFTYVGPRHEGIE